MFKRRRRDPRRPIEFVRLNPDVERRNRITLLRWRAREYRLCMTCGLVFDAADPSDGGPRQLCRCVPSNADEWRGDLSERAHLCKCCRLELLPSGSRWSVWFCSECLGRVGELNARLGRYVVPIGRHSLMGGVGGPGKAVVNATDADLAAIADPLQHSLMGMVSGMDRLQAFARIGPPTSRGGWLSSRSRRSRSTSGSPASARSPTRIAAWGSAGRSARSFAGSPTRPRPGDRVSRLPAGDDETVDALTGVGPAAAFVLSSRRDASP
jgi:hypothetical protein